MLSSESNAGEQDIGLRPPRGIWILAAIVLAVTFACSIVTSLTLGSFANSVQVHFRGLEDAALREVEAAAVTVWGRERALRRYATAETGWVWQLDRTLVTALRLRIPREALPRLEGIGIGIGLGDHWFGRDELLRDWKEQSPPGAPMLVLESPRRTIPEDRFALRAWMINWPQAAPGASESWVLLGALRWPACFVAFLLVLTLTARRLWKRPESRAWLLRALREDGHQPRGHRGWFLAGLVATSLLFGALEWTQPYFFTQDDNRVMFLPNVISAGREAARGHVPVFNPCEYAGSPRLDAGNYALTYPLLYLSYGVARWVLGEECLSMEVWAWLHLLLGYAACYWLAREVWLRPALSAAAAFSFVTSGWLLVHGRAWLGAAPVALWLPLMLIPVARLRRGPPSWREVLGLGVAVGAFFHAGNAQFWVYALVFTGFAPLLLMISGALPPARGMRLAAGLLLGLALAVPLMLPQLALVSRMERQGGLGGGILHYLHYLFLPYQAAEAVGSPGPAWPDAAKMSLPSGVALPALGLALCVILAASLPNVRDWRALAGQNVWAACALLALLLALGPEGFLWGPMSALPGFSSFSYPIKFVPYLSLFLAISGAQLAQRLAGDSGKGERIVFGAVLLLSWHVANLPIGAWTQWSIRLPYEKLPGLLATDGLKGVIDSSQRFLPLAPRWSERPDLAWTMFEALATYHGTLSLDGYSPFLWGSTLNVRVAERMVQDPIPALRAYGVRWVVQHRDYRPPVSSEDPTIPQIGKCSQLDSPRLAEQVRRAARSVGRFEAVTVWELPGADPMAFAGGQALPMAFAADGATVDTASLAGPARVVVNVLARPAFRAYADGRPVAAGSDPWDRIVVDVPAGTKQLRVRYEPPWGLSLAAGLALGLVALGLGARAMRLPDD